MADHLRLGTDLSLQSLRIVVFDEVDRLLEDGFSEDLGVIIEAMPKERQTLMFSATFTTAVRAAISAFPSNREPFVWREGGLDAETKRIGTTVDLLKDFKLKLPAQVNQLGTCWSYCQLEVLWFLSFKFSSESNTFHYLHRLNKALLGITVRLNIMKRFLGSVLLDCLKRFLQYKEAFLVQILKQYTAANPRSLVIVFTNHCKWCHLLGLILRQFGLKTAVLHSFLSQRRRLSALSRFKSNQIRVLIATDVASRGLDIPMVDLVINENVPERPKDYLHRVGRTARAGRPGLAITLVNQFELKRLAAVEQDIGKFCEKIV